VKVESSPCPPLPRRPESRCCCGPARGVRLHPVDPEPRAEPDEPLLGHEHGSARGASADPVEFEESPAQGRSERSPEVEPPLGPISACKREAAPKLPRSHHIESQGFEEDLPSPGQVERLTHLTDGTPIAQRVRESHAELPCQVVVARSSALEVLVLSCLPERRNRAGSCKKRERLHRLSNSGTRQPVPALAADALDVDEATLDERREVAARGRWRDARLACQVTCRVRSPIQQDLEHRQPRRVRQEPRHRRDIGLVIHSSRIPE